MGLPVSVVITLPNPSIVGRAVKMVATIKSARSPQPQGKLLWLIDGIPTLPVASALPIGANGTGGMWLDFNDLGTHQVTAEFLPANDTWLPGSQMVTHTVIDDPNPPASDPGA